MPGRCGFCRPLSFYVVRGRLLEECSELQSPRKGLPRLRDFLGYPDSLLRATLEVSIGGEGKTCMAEFSASPVTSPFATNALNVPAALAAGQGLQANALANAGAQQALTNQQTFRDNTAGMLARDPIATAAAYGANPSAAQAYLSALPQLDQNTRTQALQDMGTRASMAGAILNAPSDQRPALWAAGRQQLIASGAKNIPSETYPGDNALHLYRGIALTAQEQFNQQGQVLSATPQPPMQATPGGGYVGPGGVTAPAPSASNGGGLQGPLATSESGNDPTAVNAQGFAGTYQMGTGRLADLGMYKPAQGENPNSNSWQGTLSIPGYPQVKTLADFRNNPDAQDAAYGAHISNIDQTIAATPGASNYDQSGLEAVAHLGGVAGMQKFVATGGKYDPADANGTKLSDYYQRFSGSAPASATAAAPVPGCHGLANGEWPAGCDRCVIPRLHAWLQRDAVRYSGACPSNGANRRQSARHGHHA